MSDGKPLVLSDPLPRTLDLVFTPEDLAELKSFARLVHHEETRMPDDMVDQHLPEAEEISDKCGWNTGLDVEKQLEFLFLFQRREYPYSRFARS